VTALYQAASSFVEEYGLPGGLRWVSGQEATIAFLIGDWATAERLSDQFVEEVDAGAPHYLEAQMRNVRAHLRYARGDVDDAFVEARRAVALGRRAIDPQVVGAALASLAILLLEEGRADDASARR